MTTIIDIDLEVGNLTEFDNTSTDGGNLAASAAAKLHGSYGLIATINDTNDMYAEANLSGVGAGFRVRFYFDPNTVTMGNATLVSIFNVLQLGGGYANITRIYLQYTTAAGYQFIYYGKGDAGAAIYDTFNITDAVHCVEIKALRATNSTSSDGAYEIWVDGVSKASVTGVDNYNSIYDVALLGVYLEANGVPAGMSGSIYWDDLIVTNTPSTEIGQIITTAAIPVYMNQYRQRKK